MDKMNQIYHMLSMVYIGKSKMMDNGKYYYNREGIISLHSYFSLYKISIILSVSLYLYNLKIVK